MILCSEFQCNKCGISFYYPVGAESNNATDDNSVYCPSCHSDDCSKYHK